VRFRSKNGIDLDVPPKAWHQLPNMCLDHLAPAEIVMEYHRGAQRLVEILKRRAYLFEVVPGSEEIGYLYAKLSAA
jgi:hypothetical protein